MNEALQPLVMLITDGASNDGSLDAACLRHAALARAAADAGVTHFQIREKKLSAKSLFRLASEVVDAARGSGLKVLVNERADVALAAGANGVHLPSYAMPVAAVRAAFPRPFTVGVSAHTIAEVESARDAGADYATFSPVFASPGKGAPVGLDALRRAKAAVGEFTVVALGGVDAANWRDCLAAADGFAAIRFLHDEVSLGEIGRFLKGR